MIVGGRSIDCIVIGASSGGVEAINSVLSSMMSLPPVPMVVALHISPHTQFLPDAFRAPAKEAEDKEKLEARMIYFAPADYHVLLEKNGTISLSSEEPVCFARPSIDVLFESAALAYGKKVAGILLTGSNQDGAHGLKCIADAGGFTCVQEPSEAASPTMPKAAIALFKPDKVLRLHEIGRIFT